MQKRQHRRTPGDLGAPRPRRPLAHIAGPGLRDRQERLAAALPGAGSRPAMRSRGHHILGRMRRSTAQVRLQLREAGDRFRRTRSWGSRLLRRSANTRATDPATADEGAGDAGTDEEVPAIALNWPDGHAGTLRGSGPAGPQSAPSGAGGPSRTPASVRTGHPSAPLRCARAAVTNPWTASEKCSCAAIGVSRCSAGGQEDGRASLCMRRAIPAVVLADAAMGEIAQARRDRMEGTRFGDVKGYDGAPLPAPELPPVPLKPRGRLR